MSTLTTRVRSVWKYARLFRTPRDAYRYFDLRVRVASASPDDTPALLGVRSLHGVPVVCRPCRDVWTFKSTFLDGYHRPDCEIPSDGTILDLGCNVGYTVADLASRYPTARVIGVEMDAANLALARRNTAGFGNRVTLVHAAAWIRDGEIAYSGIHADGFRIDADAPDQGAMKAPARRVDSILDELGITHVDYLKMDVEGAEFALLSDAPWLDRVAEITVETHPPVTVESVVELLRDRGFLCRLHTAHPRAVRASRRDSREREDT